jgi:hypothetical protein
LEFVIVNTVWFPGEAGARNIVVSSQKDKANVRGQSEWEGTFYLREISEKAEKSPKRASSHFQSSLQEEE